MQRGRFVTSTKRRKSVQSGFLERLPKVIPGMVKRGGLQCEARRAGNPRGGLACAGQRSNASPPASASGRGALIFAFVVGQRQDPPGILTSTAASPKTKILPAIPEMNFGNRSN